MTIRTLRGLLLRSAPPWLQRTQGAPYLYALGLTLDSVREWALQGIEAGFPQLAGSDAQEYLARDHGIVRGAMESDASFGQRLSRWLQAWKRAGHAYEVMQQVADYLGDYAVPMRIVTNTGVWYDRAADGTFSRTYAASSWDWDGASSSWWRFWLIIYPPSGLWDRTYWGDASWGSGTWGSTATLEEVQTVREIVRRFKPAHAKCTNIVISYGAAGNTVASWTAGTPGGDGTIELEDWITLTCATSGTTAQTSAETLRTGFAADAARGFSRNGSTWGVLVEPRAENAVGAANQDPSGWSSPVGSPVITTVTGPDGASTGYGVEDDDGASTEFVRDSNVATFGAQHTMCLWAADMTSSSRQIVRAVESGGVGVTATPVDVASGTSTSGWTRYDATYDGAAPTTPCEVEILPAVTAANTGSLSVAFVQVEDRLYPTSFIDGTRLNTIVSLDPNEVIQYGYFDLELVARPLYAEDEAGGEHDWIYIDASTRCYFDNADSKFKLTVGGTTIETAALTWNRDDEITVRARHTPDGLTLTVSGQRTGDGSATGSAVSAISHPSAVYVWGNNLGAQAGVAAAAITARAVLDDFAVGETAYPAPDGTWGTWGDPTADPRLPTREADALYWEGV